MRIALVGAAGLALTMLCAGCQSGSAGPTPSSSSATSGMQLSLLLVCPEVSAIMGKVSASPTKEQAADIASQLESLSSRSDAAAVGYSADEFRPNAMSFGDACRTASAPAR